MGNHSWHVFRNPRSKYLPFKYNKISLYGHEQPVAPPSLPFRGSSALGARAIFITKAHDVISSKACAILNVPRCLVDNNRKLSVFIYRIGFKTPFPLIYLNVPANFTN